MRAFVTVTGTDRKGIIAEVGAFLAEKDINILDISQTIVGEKFVMIMMVDTSACQSDFSVLCAQAEEMGTRIGMSVRMQHEDIFNAMHRV